MHPTKTLSTFLRPGLGSLRLDLVATVEPDAAGGTPALSISEVSQSATTTTVTVAAHELDRFAALVAQAARLLAEADPAPDPERIRSIRRHRATLTRRAAEGDANALEALREMTAKK